STQSCLAGLSFADENEAAVFYRKVLNKTQTKKRKGPSDDVVSSSSSSNSGSWFGSSSRSSKKGKRGPIDKSQISQPTNFQHLSHIGWDPEKGFDTKNIDPSWKGLFDQLGKYGISTE
ncbi:MAG: hypothetical protein DHS80DRAFT_9540, partial [Piptocephalis tieghemiana]